MGVPVRKSGESNGVTVSTEDFIMGTSFLGAGLTVYTEGNFFFSPSVGRSVVVASSSGSDSVTSDGGFGLFFRAGKEWWVGEQWALGLSLAYRGAFGSTDLGGGDEEKFRSNNFTIAFSATFN